MGLQTEQLDSTSEETQQQPLDQQVVDQPDLPEQVDLPDQQSEVVDETVGEDSQENIVDGTPEEVVPEGQEKLEEAVAEIETDTPTEAQQEEPETIEVTPVEYTSVQDVVSSLDDLSPEVRAHVEPVIGLVKNAHIEYTEAVQKYNQARTELTEFAAEMRDYGVESDEVVQRFEHQQKQISVLNDACVTTTWRAFSRLHPEYSGQTEKTKSIFGEVVGSMLERFPGDSTLDKLEEAYKYAQYTSGESAQQSAKTQKPAATEKAKPEGKAKPPVNVNSRAQSLVADGTTPLSNPVLDVDDMSWNEILNRHLHLLE